MVKNTGKGSRKGSVDNRNQTENPKTGNFCLNVQGYLTKPDDTSGLPEITLKTLNGSLKFMKAREFP
ncbi:MAG TPA: hypothetical protein VK892_12215 [Pyrinomonadaceae bacterium]|nr:hypothetical protein [Pyrinomonadaceae bacterium]